LHHRSGDGEYEARDSRGSFWNNAIAGWKAGRGRRAGWKMGSLASRGRRPAANPWARFEILRHRVDAGRHIVVRAFWSQQRSHRDRLSRECNDRENGVVEDVWRRFQSGRYRSRWTPFLRRRESLYLRLFASAVRRIRGERSQVTLNRLFNSRPS